MADLPDIYCWIKLIDQPSGKVIQSGETISKEESINEFVTVRWVVANDSKVSTGKFLVIGSLKKDDKKKKLVNNIMEIISVGSKDIWTKEYSVPKNKVGKYSATLTGDPKGSIISSGGGNKVNEEDETNNTANAEFSIADEVK